MPQSTLRHANRFEKMIPSAGLPESAHVLYPFRMHGQHDLHIACACGHYRDIQAESIPAGWLDETGLNIQPWVWDRMVCRRCGRRGRPQTTIKSPKVNRSKGMYSQRP